MDRAALRRPVLRLCLGLAACVSLFGCAAPSSETDQAESRVAPTRDWLIVPGVRIGPVDSTTSERALIARLDPGQVVRREVQIGEGFCAPGSVIFPGTPDSVEIVWTDTTYAIPASVTVSGQSSRWRTGRGVQVGTSLAHLDSLNGGQPVRFLGFGWDYGGSGAWSEAGRTVGIVLHPDSASSEAAARNPRSRGIYGDREIDSHHPIIRTMNIQVERISIRWAEPNVQFECAFMRHHPASAR